MRFTLALLLSLLCLNVSFAQNLAPGDIAIVGLNADNPDAFAFVALVDIQAGTQIHFTDNGWLAAGGFRGGEQVVTYTASSTISAGTVLSFNSDNTNVPQFAAAGDQLLAYQGSDASPSFLYALNVEGGATWQADATSSNTSALPTGLANGSTAVAVTERDNVRYNGPTSGSQAELLAAISNASNWTGSDDNRQSFPAAFTVTGGGTGNTAPQFTQTLSSQSIDADVPFTFTYEATDADGDDLTFGLSAPPSGAMIDAASGVFTWTPSEAQAGTSYTITATVSDGTAMVQTSAPITVISSSANSPPRFTAALPDSLYDEGETVRFTYEATDDDGDPVTLTLEDAPAGVSFNTSTGLFVWNPPATGVYTVTVSASDGMSTPRTTSTIGVRGTFFPGVNMLRASLRSMFTPDQTLGYDTARDTMYAVVDLHDEGFVRGIYTGFARELVPGDPSVVMFNNGSSDGINAEHTWPQSKGAEEEPGRSDLHMLRPAKSNVNSARSNKPYAEIPDNETTAWYRLDESQSNTPTDDIDAWSESRDGAFEPREAVKGDVARSALYFYTIYEDVADEDFLLEQAQALVSWNGLDAPDGLEARRMERVERYQGNINPFLLDMTLAERAFSDVVGVGIDDVADLPSGMALSPAYPNPFNPQTTLTLTVDSFQEVRVAVYDVLGRRVRVLLQGPAHVGSNSLTFDGQGLPSGVYFVKADGQATSQMQTIMLMK